MKLRFIKATILLFFCYSCSLDGDDSANNPSQTSTIIEWHLTNVSGGATDVNIDYEIDTIIWIFNVDFNGSGTLLVQNNNETDMEDGLSTGQYAIFIAEYDNQPILFIDGEEYAGFTNPNPDSLVIDHNIHSDGMTTSDDFIFTFQRRIVD